jgi:hypothetical protein
MALETPQRSGRWIERTFLVLVGTALAFLFFDLQRVLQRDFADVNQRLSDGTMINLNDPEAGKQIRTLLQKGYYFEDPRDVNLIQTTVAKGIGNGEEIDNIGELLKSKYNIPAEEAFAKGGESFQKRVLSARALLGYTGEDAVRFVQEKQKPLQVPSVTNLSMGGRTIQGVVHNREGDPVNGVLIRLQMVLPQDSASGDKAPEDNQLRTENGTGYKRVYLMDSAGRRLQSLVAYARTDAIGELFISAASR